MKRISRRSFLKVSGALTVGFRLPAHAQELNPEINAWVVVLPNDTVVIRYARSEMGQGSMTSAAQLLAEELACDWSRVRIEYADVNQHRRRARVWGNMITAASATIRESHEYLRLAGATAREMLIAAAAQSWRVPATECSAANGIVTHAKSGRSTSYGRLVGALAKLPAPRQVKLKDPKEWKLAGKPLQRVDIPDIVTGQARYGVDIQLPGMAHAAIAHCPMFGGKLKSVDAAKILERRGVLRVVPMEDCVAVVADNWWRANEALRALPIAWDPPGIQRWSSEALLAQLREGLDADANVAIAKSTGEPAALLGYSERVIEAEYFTPFLAHATLEPQTCTAVVKDGRVDVWASTQDAEATHTAAAEVAGVSPANVYVHRTQVGGGFGRRIMQDYTREGVAIAKAMGGVPVKLMWSREEDVQHDRYRPASLVRARASLDDAGNPAAWRWRISTPAFRGHDATAALAEQPYAISHVRVEHVEREIPVPLGHWRGVAYSQNPFARECFIDELAHATNADAYEYRRRLLVPASRELQILEATAKAANWHSQSAGGAHRGIALAEAFGSYTAAVAEIALSSGGRVRIRRLVIGVDPGHVVNPDNVVAQVQGGAAFMLSAIFWGEITFKDGRAEQSNFHDLRVLRLAEMPPVEVVLAPSGGFWGGVGEAGLAAIAPALANALFAATGKPVRALPLKNAGFELA